MVMAMVTSGYNTGRKNNWRRTTWNNISKRLKSPKDAKCIYLAGEDDLDRKVALTKGFSNKNLFAVERDKDAFNLLRKSGKPAICADIWDVSHTFKGLDVINADLLGGLTKDLVDRAFIGLWSLSDGGVMCVNMLKGRDQYSTKFQKHYADLADREGIQFSDDSTHRGRQLECLLIELYKLLVVEMYKREGSAPRFDLGLYAEKFYQQMNASYFEYKSDKCNHLRYHTLIVSKPAALVDRPSFDNDVFMKSERRAALSRRVAAVKAVSTIRAQSAF